MLKEHKPRGYWSLEQIKKECVEFYRDKGGLSQSLLLKEGRSDLLAAIYERSIGLRRLIEELEITISDKETEISSEEAMRELEKMLE